MTKIEADVINFPTKLVCSACGAPGEGSCRCGVAYVTPGERAEAAVKTNPEKSDRAIADEIGVSHQTVMRERKKATGPHGPVEKRVGIDGKARKQPKQSGPRAPGQQKLRPGSEPLYAAIGAAHDAGATVEQLAKTHDVTVERINFILDVLQAARAQPELSQTAQQKLELAKRTMERKLNAEHAARMAQIDEEVRQRVLVEGREYRDRMKAREEKANRTVEQYQKWTDNLKPIFTESEFFTLMKAINPAIEHQLIKPNPELVKLLNAATILLTEKRDRLTLKK